MIEEYFCLLLIEDISEKIVKVILRNALTPVPAKNRPKQAIYMFWEAARTPIPTVAVSQTITIANFLPKLSVKYMKPKSPIKAPIDYELFI